MKGGMNGVEGKKNQPGGKKNLLGMEGIEGKHKPEVKGKISQEWKEKITQ